MLKNFTNNSRMLLVLPKRSFLLKVLKDRTIWPRWRGLSDSIKCSIKSNEHTYTERLNYSLEYKHPGMTYLMYYYLHIYEFWIKLSFCSRVHLCEIWKVFPIIYQRATTLTHLTPLEKQELYDGFYQMIRSIPFILAVVIPFGEAIAPIILIRYPNVFPRSFSCIFKSDINSFLVLLQKMIKYWDAMITESLLTSHDVTLFHRLSSKQIKMKILELKKRLTIKDLGEITSRFQAEFFLNTHL
ncbi:hypothetical protein RF11_01418 [Thelohanellus kitauei]|uniref:Letm1 RBD domain-containing protein n=1 Tax=Thelohanellus kitauei TaxID=669202 RepID=A0A0C2MG78_THEKT|nr:hypothetical protein RF11_01418 [Thelohanellus kitauei]